MKKVFSRTLMRAIAAIVHRDYDERRGVRSPMTLPGTDRFHACFEAVEEPPIIARGITRACVFFSSSFFSFLDRRASWRDAREGSPAELHRRTGSLYHIRA